MFDTMIKAAKAAARREMVGLLGRKCFATFVNFAKLVICCGRPFPKTQEAQLRAANAKV